MWASWITMTILNIDPALIGIFPQKAAGLPGIILSPFTHGNLAHIASNSISFIILSGLLFYFYRLIAYRVFFLTWLISGVLLWIGGRETYHIGASGIVYGLAFFILFSGIFRKDKKLGALSLVVVFLYGSMIWGMLPQNTNISWEGHLFGALSGISMAWYFRNHPIDFIPEDDGSSVSVTWGRFNSYEYQYIEEEDTDEEPSSEL